MAVCTLVDRHDRVIGYKERDQLKPGDIYRVASLWIVNDKGEVLLSRRVLSKLLDPNKWGPAAAGTVENNETYDENITKEASEELGIADAKFTPGPKYFVSDNGHGQGYFCQTYVATLNWSVEQFTLQAEEVAEVRWVSIDALEQEIVVSPEHFVANFSEPSTKMIRFICQYWLDPAGT
jgi:isopentenyl-diphosphate delta-isomerase